VHVAPAESVFPQVVDWVNELAFVPLIVKALNVIEAVPLFVSVSISDALLPLNTLPKESELSEKDRSSEVPEPVSATDCVPELTLLGRFNVAVKLPAAVGAKTIVTVHELPAARVVAQVVDSVKALAFVPLIENALSVIAAVPLFVSVSVKEDVLPLTTLPKASAPGDNVSAAA